MSRSLMSGCPAADAGVCSRISQKCEAAGLKKTGTKDELVARVREHEGPLPEEEDKGDEDAEEGGKGKKAKKAKASPAKKVSCAHSSTHGGSQRC